MPRVELKYTELNIDREHIKISYKRVCAKLVHIEGGYNTKKALDS